MPVIWRSNGRVWPSMPEVGIFWLIDNKLVANSIPRRQADIYGGFYSVIKAYPAETTEAFLDGHISAFAFFGGVPLSILYDNLKIAVARILGDGKRQRTRAFTELVSHYLFQERFGRRGRETTKARSKLW